MPFTVAHTVAVIPLYKYLGKFGALSALIIGSMTPDFAYLTPYLVDQRMDSHSLLGVYLFGIPMGLTVYFSYHLLMAPVIFSVLPKPIKPYLHADLSWGRLPNIPAYTLLFSLILGALTHVFWDFFTHQSGLPQHISWMDTPLSRVDGYDIMPYRLLQHFSSLFGLSLLLFWIWTWISKNKHRAPSPLAKNHWQAPLLLKKIAIIVLLVVPLLSGIYMGGINMPSTDVMYGIYSLQVFIRFGIVGAAGGFILSCIFLGLLYQYWIYKEKRR